MKLTLRNEWHYFLTAVMFFTRIPVHIDHFNENDLNKATRYFSLIGILVGGAGALVFWLSHIILPVEVSILLSITSTLLLTGAFHEDGLADATDGLGGGLDKERVLTIMVDSRIGSYGAIALLMAILTKYQALSYLYVGFIPMSLVAGHALSRLCAVLVMATQSYVKATGKAKPLATELNKKELAMAIFFGLTPMLFLEIKFTLALVPVALVFVWFSAKIKSRIGGYTGDCLGAMQQLTEVVFYVSLLACVRL